MIQMIKTPLRPALPSSLILIFLFLSSTGPAAAAREKLELRYLPLPLPGAPSAVVAADVDGDGHRDLAVVVAYTRWSQIEIQESTTMDDVEGLVEVLTVIPSLVERREIRIFPGHPDGGFGPGSVALPIDTSILTVEAGPPGLPVVAMTDDGLSVLRMKSRTSPGASGPPELSWETVLSERSVLAGTGTFLPNLGLVRDVDGDQRADVLFPTLDGISVYLSDGDGLKTPPADRVRFPLDDLQRKGNPLVRRYPLPELRDVDATGDPTWSCSIPRASCAASACCTTSAAAGSASRSHPWGPIRLLRTPGRGRTTATTRRTIQCRPGSAIWTATARPST